MDEYKKFFYKFNCACSQILSANHLIKFGSPPGITNSILKTNIWNSEIKSTTRKTIHPFNIILDGSAYNKYYSQIYAIEIKFKLEEGSAKTFIEGFYNDPEYRDCYTDDKFLSLTFNIGRAFLHKYGKVKLQYTIPNDYNDVKKVLNV